MFWIEENIEVSYNQFLIDLQSGKSSYGLFGYNYFFNLIKGLLRGYIPNSIDDLISYLITNKGSLNFNIHTSGTTSTPKKINVNLGNCIRYVKTNSSDFEKRIWGMGYPVGSFASSQVFFQSFINQETIIYLFGIDFKTSDSLFLNHNISNLNCTPTFLSMLLIHLKNSFSSIKKITTGGEKVKNNLIKSINKTFKDAQYVNIYASTETGSLLYSNSEFFSIPKKYKDLIKIQDNTIWVHSNLLNSSTDLNEDTNWFNTNDIVEYINETEFRFISRSNGYLNTGGFRISPSEIEDILIKMDNIIDVHVYGKPNSLLGTIICADIIGDDIDSKKIKSDLMKKSTEKHLIPQVIRIVDSFEHVFNGKKKLMI